MEKINNGESGLSVREKLNELINKYGQVNSNASEIKTLQKQTAKCNKDITEIASNLADTQHTIKENADKISTIESQILSITKKIQYGLRNGNAITISAGDSIKYELLENSLLYGIILPEQCNIKIGRQANASDLGTADDKGVVQLGFLSGEIYLTADKDIELIPIIYKF